MNWQKASVIVAVLVGTGTILSWTGVQKPWMSAAEGATLEQDVQHLSAVQAQGIAQERRDAVENRVSNLQTQKTILMVQQSQFRRGSPGYQLLQAQIEGLDNQIKHPN